jgi:hypothetical protein
MKGTGGASVLLGLAQRINDALDASDWHEAELLATSALERARLDGQARWAERFERLRVFARERGSIPKPTLSEPTCSFCAGTLGGDRFVAGATVFICSACIALLCRARALEGLPATDLWRFRGDAEPTEVRCLFCGLGPTLFVGIPGGICDACLSTAAGCIDAEEK